MSVFCARCTLTNLYTSVKGARTCWECKQRHGRCWTAAVGGAARAAPTASAEPTVAHALGEMAAQVLDLTVHSLGRSEAIARLETKVDALTSMVKWMADVMGAEDIAARERELKMSWAKSLERMEPASAEETEDAGAGMEVDEARAPSTSDTGDAETTDEEEEQEEEEEGQGWKGKGKAREETDEEERGDGEETSEEE